MLGRRRSRVNLLFYCSLIYNFFQWKMMRISYIISLVTSFPALCALQAQKIFVWQRSIRIYCYNKNHFRRRSWWRTDELSWQNELHERIGGTWKPASFVISTVPLKFYLLLTADRHRCCRSAKAVNSFLSPPPFLYYSIIYSHFSMIETQFVCEKH